MIIYLVITFTTKTMFWLRELSTMLEDTNNVTLKTMNLMKYITLR